MSISNYTLGIINHNLPVSLKIAEEAHNLSINVVLLSDIELSNRYKCAFDNVIIGSLLSKNILKTFANKCDIVTYLSNNVPISTLKYLNDKVDLVQGLELISIIKDRSLEKRLFEEINVNNYPYTVVTQLDDIYGSISSIGFPAVLSPIQRKSEEQKLLINSQADIALASDMLLKNGPHILEARLKNSIDYDVYMAKSSSKENNIRVFPALRIQKTSNGLLEAYLSNDLLSSELISEMKRLSTLIAMKINYYGLFKITLSISKSKNIFVKGISIDINEISMIFNKAFNINAIDLHLRSLLGLSLPLLKQYNPVILATFNKDVIDSIDRQLLIKNNWKFYYLNDDNGYIILQPNSLKLGLNQLLATNIW